MKIYTYETAENGIFGRTKTEILFNKINLADYTPALFYQIKSKLVEELTFKMNQTFSALSSFVYLGLISTFIPT